MNKKSTVIISALLVVILLMTGYVAIATSYGSKDDPIVTLSYINSVVKPEVTKNAGDIASKAVKEYEIKIKKEILAFSKELDAKIAKFESNITKYASDAEFVSKLSDEIIKKGGNASCLSDVFSVVNISKGKKLSADIGTELILRTGSAKCYSVDSLGIVNLSSGSELPKGKNLLLNNLYLVSGSNKGLTAQTDVSILIKGSYKIH